MTNGPWRDRIGGLRVNASTMSHAELDESEVLGGCCGTDARHVSAMWGV